MKLKICIFHHWASHKLLGRSEVIVTKAVSVSTIAACTDAATSASFDFQQKSPNTKGNCKLALKWTILAANGQFSFERYSCQFSRCECTIFITPPEMHTQNILRGLYPTVGEEIWWKICWAILSRDEFGWSAKFRIWAGKLHNHGEVSSPAQICKVFNVMIPGDHQKKSFVVNWSDAIRFYLGEVNQWF